MKYLAVLTTDTISRPRVRPLTASMRWLKASHSPTMLRAVRARSWPASVRRTRRATSSYSGTPTASATSRSCIDAVGWVTCSARAAAVTLPVSASARNSRSCRKVMFIGFC